MNNLQSNVLSPLTGKPGGVNPDHRRFDRLRPATVRQGSATHLVLRVFQSQEAQWLSHSNVQWLARLDGHRVVRALHYLQKLGLIEQATGCEGETRSTRYRLINGNQHAIAKVAVAIPVLGAAKVPVRSIVAEK